MRAFVAVLRISSADRVLPLRHMQDCFRKYPDVYGSELADDEDDEATQTQEAQHAVQEGKGEEAVTQSKGEIIPPKAHDAMGANKESKEEHQESKKESKQ